jgi:quercetin dioxygenase-like cupin family protein
MKFSELSQLTSVPVRHNEAILKRMMLQPGDAQTIVQFSQALFPSGEGVAAHADASMHEVFYVLSGKAEFIVNGIRHTATEGGCLLAEAGDSHALRNIGDAPLLLLFFGVECGDE